MGNPAYMLPWGETRKVKCHYRLKNGNKTYKSNSPATGIVHSVNRDESINVRFDDGVWQWNVPSGPHGSEGRWVVVMPKKTDWRYQEIGGYENVPTAKKDTGARLAAATLHGGGAPKDQSEDDAKIVQ